MRRSSLVLTTAVAATTGLAALGVVSDAGAARPNGRHPQAEHVLVLSVDGLHSTDLARYVRQNPRSALARLVHGGTDYVHAQTTFPSDSFPGTVAQFTGGGPGEAGIYYDDTADRLVGAATGDPHTPDLIGLVQHGVVYTGGVKKIAEHGGDSADDRDVALVVSGAGVRHGSVDRRAVQTTQIAPTILRLLNLQPNRLKAVRTVHTRALPTR